MMIISKKKFQEIKVELESIKEKFNFVNDFLLDFEKIKEDMSQFKQQVNEIYESLNYEPTPEEMKEQEKAAQESIDEMKLIVRAAISDMLNDPKNQENLQSWASGLTGAMAGNPLGSWAGLMNEDGSVNWGVAIQQFLGMGKGGNVGIGKGVQSKKPGAY